jgi:lipoprotein-releasing system permease protein
MMSLPFFIAKRYLISRRSRNIINVISWISLAGIGIGTMALIIVLSIFNGIEGLIKSMFSSFDPDLKISLVEGKTFTPSGDVFRDLKDNPSVAFWCEVLEDNALLSYRERQTPATLKGVGDNFNQVSNIENLLIDGKFKLEQDNRPLGIIGSELAYRLGVGLNFINPMHVYYPRRTSSTIINPLNAFTRKMLFPSAIFSVQQEYDSKYMIVPIDFCRDLMGYDDEVSAIEIGVAPGQSVEKLKLDMEGKLGDEFKVENRFEQHSYFYKVMASEKWAIFLILGFILIIASFNTISSLTLLLLEKKKDMHVLQSMGARVRRIRRIFLTEGLLMTGIGILAGLAIGSLLCWMQMTFGIIRFPSSGSYVTDIYPVKMEVLDFLLVALMVMAIGLTASAIPVRVLGKRYFSSFDGTELSN